MHSNEKLLLYLSFLRWLPRSVLSNGILEVGKCPLPPPLQATKLQVMGQEVSCRPAAYAATPQHGTRTKQCCYAVMDSTMLVVCKLIRADRHRVARGIAQFGKNWQGWHYDFKLHAACNQFGRLAAARFTPANASDSQQIPHLVNDATRVAVGDGGYTASVMVQTPNLHHLPAAPQTNQAASRLLAITSSRKPVQRLRPSSATSKNISSWPPRFQGA